MSGEDELNKYDDPKLTGIGRYFNSTTIRGRANVAIATYAVLIGYFVYAKFLKKKCPECPVDATKKNMKRFSQKWQAKKWIRVEDYLNRYISKDYRPNIKNVSLTTISFLSGFFFYQKVILKMYSDEDFDCRCSNQQKVKNALVSHDTEESLNTKSEK